MGPQEYLLQKLLMKIEFAMIILDSKSRQISLFFVLCLPNCHPGQDVHSPRLTQTVLCSIELREAFAFSRLQMLERQVVGGEQAKNKDLKEKHKRRKKYADERRMQLVTALQQSNEDSSEWVLLNVYDSIQEEVRAKSKLLEKMQKKVSSSLLSLLKI